MSKKFKVLLSVFVLILITSVGVVAAFALTRATVKSSFRIKYIGTRDVYATITAESYASYSQDPIETIDPVVFNKQTSSQEQTVESNFETEITVKYPNGYVWYVFTITNDSTLTRGRLAIKPALIIENEFIQQSIEVSTDNGSTYALLDGEYVVLEKGDTVKIKLGCKSTTEEDLNLEGDISVNLYSENEFKDLGIS